MFHTFLHSFHKQLNSISILFSFCFNPDLVFVSIFISPFVVVSIFFYKLLTEKQLSVKLLKLSYVNEEELPLLGGTGTSMSTAKLKEVLGKHKVLEKDQEKILKAVNKIQGAAQPSQDKSRKGKYFCPDPDFWKFLTVATILLAVGIILLASSWERNFGWTLGTVGSLLVSAYLSGATYLVYKHEKKQFDESSSGPVDY